MVEATGKHFLRESDEVRRGVEIPLFVTPEAASGAYASLYLVDNHEYA